MSVLLIALVASFLVLLQQVLILRGRLKPSTKAWLITGLSANPLAVWLFVYLSFSHRLPSPYLLPVGTAIALIWALIYGWLVWRSGAWPTHSDPAELANYVLFSVFSLVVLFTQSEIGRKMDSRVLFALCAVLLILSLLAYGWYLHRTDRKAHSEKRP